MLTNKNCLPNTNVLSGLHSLLYKFQYTDSVTTKGLAFFFEWDVYVSLLRHDLQGLNGVLSEKHEHNMEGSAVGGTAQQPFEGQLSNYIECIHVGYESSSKGSFDDLQCYVKGCCDIYALDNKSVEVGHQESSIKCHAGSHGSQDFWSLHPEKSKEDIRIPLFFILYNPGEPELWLLKTSSGKPSGIWAKLIEMARCTPYEQTELHEEKVKCIFYLYSQKSSHGVQYFSRVCNFATQRLQLCQHICRSNSSFRKPGLAPLEASSLSWIISLWSLPVHPRSLCSLVFRVFPKVLKLSPGLLSKLQGPVHPQLMDIVAGKLPELPQEILMDIFALLEIPDLVRAGSVCTSWNSAYTSICKIGQQRQPQTLCLLYSSESAGENVACLYSLAEKRAYKLTLPEPPIHRRYLIGSSHGWVITVDERSEMHLVNPITSEQLALPSVITFEQVEPIYDSTGVICKYHYYSMNKNTRSVTRPPLALALRQLRYHFHHKALLFHDDASAGSYIVVLIHIPGGQIAFARLGDEKWTRLPSHRYFQDCIYKDGLLYAVTSFGTIVAFDLSGPVVTKKIIMDRVNNCSGMQRFYIVQAPWGDLLQVRRPEVGITKEADGNQNPSTFVNKTKWMEIYKVCGVTRKREQINNLGDHVLFLGSNQSLCCRAKEYPQLKPNHVYFTDDISCVEFACKRGYRLNIGVLDFGSKRMEEIIYPRPWSNCLAPLFVVPNPRKMDLALHV